MGRPAVRRLMDAIKRSRSVRKRSIFEKVGNALLLCECCAFIFYMISLLILQPLLLCECCAYLAAFVVV